MILLLHCGYHKTASSYFQACFAHGQELLLKNGIHHPADPLQEKVLSGKPTAGNGDPLCQALLKQDKEKSRKLLHRYVKEAQEHGAGSVLLSTEGYFTCFTNRAIVDLFTELVKEAGFQSTRALIFFRDPVDHAISVYCHRAPSGKLPAFSDWLEKGFETPVRMDAFAAHFNVMPIEWQIRKFQPKVKDIAEVCFADWLQIPEAKELAALTSEVNVSVSISESELIRNCQQSFPGSGRYVGRSLKEVDRKQKPGEAALRKSYEHLAARYFQRHQGVIEKINRLLPADEQLFLPAVSADAAPAPAPVFSSDQVVAFAQGVLACKHSQTPGGRLRRYLNRTGEQLKELFDLAEPVSFHLWLKDHKEAQPQALPPAALGTDAGDNLTWTQTKVVRAERWGMLGQSGVVVWLTGLSGSGKSTLAVGLDNWLHGLGFHSRILDGDNLRQGLCKGLTFAEADRVENIRRTGEAAKLLAEAGLIAICSLISPFAEQREAVRRSCEAAGVTFLEVFVNAPLGVCENRDPRGLYHKARAGQIQQFTGITSPYERPANPDMELHTDLLSPEACISQLATKVIEAASVQPGSGLRWDRSFEWII